MIGKNPWELQKISLLATTMWTESPSIFLDWSDSASRVTATAHVFQKVLSTN